MPSRVWKNSFSEPWYWLVQNFEVTEPKNLFKIDNILYFVQKALLKLSHPLEITSAIQPIKLPDDCGEQILDYQLVTAIGTGFTELDWTDKILREANLVTLPNKVCGLENSERLICTESKGTATPFFGDSGK